MAQWGGRATWDSIDRGDWATCRIRAGRRNREPVERWKMSGPREAADVARNGQLLVPQMANHGSKWKETLGSDHSWDG